MVRHVLPCKQMREHDDCSLFVARTAIDIQRTWRFCYIQDMDEVTNVKPKRRPRFRRAEAPAFRLTDDDVVIIRQIARHRFVKSTHIAALVGRSLDRTNDRLSRLFHAGHIDRPRAQLDYYPSSGSEPMVYALTERGERLLEERFGGEAPHFEWA